MKSLFPTDRPWPGFQKWLFRFTFISVILVLDPVEWIAGLLQQDHSAVYEKYQAIKTSVVTWAGGKFFHIRPVLVQPRGSGDTSFEWTLVCCILCAASIGSVIWSFADRARPNYERLGYLFRNYVRVNIAAIAFAYGVSKIFLHQMGMLSPTDLATPVGNLSLMRMCWYFVAASPPYQVFSGLTEVMVAMLLLFRSTVTLGLLLGLAVFANVMVLNYAYDIPDKIFSTEIVLCCGVLLFRDYERIVSFLILNRNTARGTLYDPYRRGFLFALLRVMLKLGIIFSFFLVPAWPLIKDHFHSGPRLPAGLFPPGVYQITRFTRNGDSTGEKKRWTMLVFDKKGRGTITGDSTLFKYRYGRSVFTWTTDTVRCCALTFKTAYSDNPAEIGDSARLKYDSLSPGRFRFSGISGTDSLAFDASRSDHRYPLGEWQFHWLQEDVP